MKSSIFVALALTVLPSVANRCLHAQPVSEDVGELLTASTICVVSISAEAIESPQGLLATDVFRPAIGMLSEFSRDQDILITFDMQQPSLASSATMHTRSKGASLAEVNAKLKPHGLGPAVKSASFVSVSLLPSDRRGPAKERLPVDVSRLEELRLAFETAEGSPIRIAILPPEHLWRVYREVVPTLPVMLGGGDSSVLIDGMTWAGVGLDPKELAIESHVQAADQNAAIAFSRAVPTWMKAVVDQTSKSQWKELGPVVRATLQNIKIKTDGAQVHLSMLPTIGNRQGGDVAQELFERALAPINMRRKLNQLKQIMLAMHNHVSAYKYFPPSPKARGRDGKATLSWRVHLLPFLGDKEVALWEEFHLDEPWDSEHNKTLIARMPDVYATPSGLMAETKIKPGHTRYLAPLSDKTLMGQPEAVGFGHITDGTSNTIGVVEVSDENAVPWTAPQDYVFDPENPAKGLHVDADGRVNCAILDGSTHRIEVTLPPKTFRLLYEMNDGQVVQVP